MPPRPLLALLSLTVTTIAPQAWAAPPEDAPAADADAPAADANAPAADANAPAADADAPADEAEAPADETGPNAEAGPEPESTPEPEPEPAETSAAPPATEITAAEDTRKWRPKQRQKKHRILYTNLIGARLNPLGLEERLWIGYQYRLYNKQESFWNQSNIAVFFNPIVSPAITRIGATVQVQPLSILRLRATYGMQAWYGSFQFIQSYDTPREGDGPVDFSPATQVAAEEAGENYGTLGAVGEFGLLFQIKVGRVAVRSDTNVFRHDVGLNNGHDVFYSIRLDALVPNHGMALVNDSDILWVTSKGATFGVRGTTTKAFFPKKVFLGGQDTKDPVGAMFRVGPMFAYTFFDKPERSFNKPTLFVISQWHAKQPWRTTVQGEGLTSFTHPAYPTISLGFAFFGDLWAKN